MPPSLIPAFLTYCYISAITPGPANLASLAAALRYGRGPALRQWKGLFIGFAIVAAASVIVVYLLGAALNSYVKYLAWIGAAYILWMAWHILRSSDAETERDPSYPTFRTGLMVQLTNVKIMVMCVTALSGYVLPYTHSFWRLLAVGLFLPFTGPICNLAWLFTGASLERFFREHRRVVDIVMAAALALCAVSLVWPR